MKRASDVPPVVDSTGVRPVTSVTAFEIIATNGPGEVRNTSEFDGSQSMLQRIEWEPSNADVFYTEPSPFTDVVIGAVAEVTGRKPALSTSGGTSDARFIKDYCPVVEFGLVGTTMHQIDEHVPLADLKALTAVYRKILQKYFG